MCNYISLQEEAISGGGEASLDKISAHGGGAQPP